MASYLLPILALIIGTLIGLQLPDTDQVFTLIGLVHRSIITHGLLLPLGAYLLIRKRMRWLQMGVAGLCLAIAVHLTFDLFPRSWYGYALITVPLVGQLDPTLTVLWLTISMLTCCLLALRLLRDRRDLVLALVAAGWGFITSAGRERVWLMPLVVLVGALFLASCLPNPAFDGRAAARRWVERTQQMRRP
ncbi:MAG: hypothetical protein WCF99_00425 [Chloroflexales bacterium]